MTESDTLTHVGFVWTALTTWTVALLEMLRAHSKQLGDRTRTCAMVSCLIFPNRLLGSQARRSLNILRGYHIDTSKKRKIIYPPNVWLNIHYFTVRFFSDPSASILSCLWLYPISLAFGFHGLDDKQPCRLIYSDRHFLVGKLVDLTAIHSAHSIVIRKLIKYPMWTGYPEWLGGFQ